MKPLRVLSLFDGISCGQVAFERAGIPIEVYYASEIDKYAIQITQKNYPNTIQLGDVTKIDFTQFIGKIDILIGGSPCQDLSIAGKRKGLSGERSGLFYKYVEALETIKPKYFLLENNVGMPKEAYEEISRLMGCYPVEINGALVSAQNRKRYYWTNIGPHSLNLFGFATCQIPQPENKGILLKDVLESGFSYQNKSDCLTARYQGATFPHDYERNQRTMVAEPICVNSKSGNGNTQPSLSDRIYSVEGKNTVLTSGWMPYIAEPLRIPEATKKGYVEINQGECVDLSQLNSKTRRGRNMKDKSNALLTQNEFYQYISPVQLGHISNTNSQANRVYSVVGKSVTLKAECGGGGAKTGLYKIDLPDGEYYIRKLTPVECERLQTLPDGYTEGVSNTQRYKAIGNGWTVDVIAHIFSFLKEEK
ncbi:MAG: DNA cytosine methyltransferase [Candidatus Gastranaerophilales bacterium]|nr:DNA cytosine methyltransferase [Candidatus Gastranaerophilales bacterium]